MTSEHQSEGGVAAAVLREGGGPGFLARWWPAVSGVLWLGAALAGLLALLLEPSLAERLLSADGRLEPASRTVLRVMQAVSAAVALMLFEAGRRFRYRSVGKERLVLGAVFASAATLVSLLLCEAGLRAASNLRPLTAERHFFFVHDDTLGWRHRPGAVARFKDATVRINSNGLRDDELAAAAAASEFRVLFLGDSQVFGDGVEGGETLVQRFEAEFEGVQAINAGVIGYGTDQQVLYYEREGAALAPRVTFVGLNAYDLRDNIANRVRSGYLKPRFELADTGLRLVNVPVSRGSLVDRIQRYVRSQSYLYTFLTSGSRLRGRGAGGDASEREFPDVYPPGARIEAALGITGELLGRLAADVHRREGRLVVLFLPYEMDFGADEAYRARSNRLVRTLEERGQREGFLTWDLRPYLDPSRRLYLDRMHFSREGHRQVAAALKALCLEHGLIRSDHAR